MRASALGDEFRDGRDYIIAMAVEVQVAFQNTVCPRVPSGLFIINISSNTSRERPLLVMGFPLSSVVAFFMEVFEKQGLKSALLKPTLYKWLVDDILLI